MSRPYQITYTIKDDKGRTSQHRIYVSDNGQSIAQVKSFAGFYGWEILNVATTGAIVGINISIPVDLHVGMRTVPLPESDVEEYALLTFRTEAGTKTRMTIPAVNEMFVAAGGQFSVAGLGLATASSPLHYWETPDQLTEAWTFAPTDQRGNDIELIIAAETRFKRSK